MLGRRPMAKAAVEAGITIAWLGPDTAGAPRMGRNAMGLVQLVEAGVTPLQAITAATLSSARALGMEDHLGSVEVGKRSDLLVLERDPLADIASLLARRIFELMIQSDPADVLQPAA